MEFGKLPDISGIDFSLPENPADNNRVLSKSDVSKKLEIFTGCPVWANKEWVGIWYPAHAKEKDFLKLYSQQFNTIELNTTHYRIPDEHTIQRWYEESSEGFKFCPKIFQEISHHKILDGTFQRFTDYFCHQVMGLKEKLGISFLQLPPYLSPTHTDLLIRFLEHFPLKEVPLSIEFRNEQWFQHDALADMYAYMVEKGVHSIFTDVAGRRDVLHLRLSSDIVQLRFVGNALHPTDFQRVDQWVVLLDQWRKEGLKEIYFFAHEPDNLLSPDLANYFTSKMSEKLDIQLAQARSYRQPVQGRLF